MEKALKYKHLTYCNGELEVQIAFYDSAIKISATRGYMDWGTGNRMGFIHNTETARVPVDGSMSIEDLRREVLRVASRLAKYDIPIGALAIGDFERYK